MVSKYRWNIIIGTVTGLMMVIMSKMSLQDYTVTLGILSLCALFGIWKLKRSDKRKVIKLKAVKHIVKKRKAHE